MNETVSIPTRTPEAGGHAFVRATATAPDRAELHSLLRTALALEHATIPPYLTAMYSLKGGKNREVGGIIRSVVMQEMLHLALIGNIMNAVGATPRFDDPKLVPVYPGRLPGGVMPDLEVSLGACSIERVREVFMGIELPEAPSPRPARENSSPFLATNLSWTRTGTSRTSPQRLSTPLKSSLPWPTTTRAPSAGSTSTSQRC
ncbi:ferritin-like protein [Streptomyces sp. AcE210]|uniref:ferritin-like domain-containing protein n=1 Tax=Streptomyces sp. AcE210 TaxID=2292703 RepID=UPI000E30196F|nr:ferritin-like protein [Streptomyces sp. AcE210]RFC69762.1 hypothetical protein DXZ75_20095 [Streptomyces sp. AcE210]